MSNQFIIMVNNGKYSYYSQVFLEECTYEQ